MQGFANLDNSYAVESPAGIDLQARVAGPLVRILAYSVDSIIRLVITVVLWLVLLAFDRAGFGILLVLMFIEESFYPVLFEVFRNGQTPGKRLFRLQVIDDRLTSIGLGASVTRNLLRVADFFPLGYLTGLCTMVSNDRFARLGDLAAGTLVIYQQVESKTVSLPDAPLCAPLPGMDANMQRAIIAFTQRHQNLSQDRQRELADILAPLLHQHGDAAVDQLRGMGLHLLGER